MNAVFASAYVSRVAKRQGASLLVSTRLDDMHVVGVRPSRRPMKKRAERIVEMGHVDVSQLNELWNVGRDWVKPLDRDLDIDDWLRGKTGNRRRAVVIDSKGERTQSGSDPVALGQEDVRPIRVVGNDFENGDHPLARWLRDPGGPPGRSMITPGAAWCNELFQCLELR